MLNNSEAECVWNCKRNLPKMITIMNQNNTIKETFVLLWNLDIFEEEKFYELLCYFSIWCYVHSH